MTRIKLVGSCVLFVLVCAAVGRTQETKVAMIPVSYDGLKQEVLKQRGKVVLVDFWASWCLPCKKGFPHVMELHGKYAKEGFVVLTVSTDVPTEEEPVAAANAFLKKSNAPFRHLLLNEAPERWSKTLNFTTIPCYYLFDRSGKWVRFGGDTSGKGIDFEALEKSIKQMLTEK